MNKSISARLRAYRIHLLAWSLFIAYEIWVVWALNGTLSTFTNYATHYSLVIGWFYLAGDFVFPHTFRNLISAFWKFPIALIALFAIFTFASYLVDYTLIYNGLIGKKAQLSLDQNYITRALFRYVYILGIALAYFFVKNFISQKNISLSLEKQKLQMIIEDERTKRALSKAHNDFLKAQINPHFLFNTLDYVYHSISVDSPEAADAILTLSDMMRYAVDSADQQEFLPLALEMEQVEKLIYLYQLRKKHELNIIVDFSPQAAELYFIPLVLITLVENIFKHGNINNAEIGVQIYVGIDDDKLIIESLNALNLNARTDSTKAGLNNVVERLGFAYGEGAKCIFNSDGQAFQARVEVSLNALKANSIYK